MFIDEVLKDKTLVTLGLSILTISTAAGATALFNRDKVQKDTQDAAKKNAETTAQQSQAAQPVQNTGTPMPAFYDQNGNPVQLTVVDQRPQAQQPVQQSNVVPMPVVTQ